MSESAEEPTKPCPFCGEKILAVAIKCKHCGSDLQAQAGSAAKKPGEALGILMLVLPLVGVALIWLWIANMNLLQGPRTALGVVLGLVVLGTAALAAVEASQLGMGSRPDSKGKQGSGPITWFFGTVLLWIICFPLYLFQRSRYGATNLLIGGVGTALLFGGSAYLIESAIQTKLAELQSNPLANALANALQGGERNEPMGGAISAYARRSKMVEASMNVRKLADSATSYYEGEHADISGNILPKQFPASIGLTPARSCCEQGGKCMPDQTTWNNESWAALNFSVDDPYYFQYEFTSSGTEKNAKFTARAIGDIDCSGRKSVFERSGHVLDDGSVQITPLKTNE